MSELSQYPVGRYQAPAEISAAQRKDWIEELRAFPRVFRAAAEAADLAGPYRADGWTGRQVVHHVADSHMNSYVRFKLALTEDVPLIKPYDEARWAELADTAVTPVETSLRMIELLHERWLNVLDSMSEEQWHRRFRHPEIGEISLGYALGLYAWHGRHHAAHLGLIRRP